MLANRIPPVITKLGGTLLLVFCAECLVAQQVWFNTGRLDFSPVPVVFQQVISSVATDLNGDGKLDLITADQGTNVVAVSLGNGNGSFQPAVTYPVGTGPNQVVVGDLNGDDIPDLIVVNSGSGSVSVLLGKGDGTFQKQVVTNVGQYPYIVGTGDFNGDGKMDVVVSPSLPNFDSALLVLLGNGDGTFNPLPSIDLGPLQYPRAVADLNGDGKPDVVVNGSTIAIYLGKGDGTFQSPIRTSPGDSGNPLVVADFNRDGKLDLALSGSVLLGKGDGTFEKPIPLGTPPPIVQFTYATGDFNSDGIPDLILCCGELLLGNGDGTFRAGPALEFSGSMEDLPVVGDFNGDKKLDVATVSEVGSNYVWIVELLLGNGNGTFQTELRVPVSPMQTSLGQGPILVGDFNGDSIPDVIVVTEQSVDDQVVTLLGKGDGTFEAPMVLNCCPSSVPSVAVSEDFNHDGKLDLAVGNGSQVSVFLGKGDGTFQHQSDYALNNSPVGIVAADISGDGIPDLVTIGTVVSGHSVFGYLSVLLGHGDGSFAAPQSILLADAPSSLVAADFNQDGKLDLATADLANLCVYLGNGDGTFVVPSSCVNGFFGFLAVGDLNGDGKPDILGVGTAPISLGAGLTPVSLYFGVGDGTFQNPVFLPVDFDGTPVSAVLADFNMDHVLDVAVVNGASSDVSILINQGNGTFMSSGNFGVKTPGAIASADFNRDGASDLVLTSSTGLSLLLNTPVPASDFSLTPKTTTLTVASGGQVTDLMTVAGVNGAFGGAVQLACAVSGPSVKPTCALSPTSVTPVPNPVTSTLTITAPASVGGQFAAVGSQPDKFLYAAWAVLMVGITVVGGIRKRYRYWGLYGLLMLSFLQAACGGNAGGGKPGAMSYVVTVTATSGAIQHTAQATVTVD